MPTTAIVRAVAEAPPIDSTYAFAMGDQAFVGIVREHRALPRTKTHVAAIVEISTEDNKRLILGDPADNDAGTTAGTPPDRAHT